MSERDTRESVELDYRYDSTNALLDLMLAGEMTLEEVKEAYAEDFGDQNETA